jgi:hypothetical protein
MAVIETNLSDVILMEESGEVLEIGNVTGGTEKGTGT